MTLEERVAILYRFERDADFQEACFKLIDDPDLGDAFFINVFCWTYDPRNGPDDKPIGPVPFLLDASQEEAVARIGRAMDKGYDCGIEKPRDRGATWMVLACIAKRYLRVEGFSALIGSMTETLVDSAKSTASLGWKIDFILDNLPRAFVPKLYQKDKHRTWMNWVNPDKGCTIEGRAPTAKFPVGDRKTVAYYDDWAQWEHGSAAWKSAAATTDCRIATWTVNPQNPRNHAYEARFSKGEFEGTRWGDLITVADLHWTKDPRKQETATDPITGRVYNVWQRKILAKISQEQFERDYEGVYESSAKGRIYAAQMPSVRVGHFPYDPRFPLYTSWDFGVGDTNVIGFLQFDWEQYRMRWVDVVVRSGQDTGYYIPFVTGRLDPKEVLPYEHEYDDADRAAIDTRTSWQRRVWDAKNEQWIRRVVYEDHFGDPAGQNRGGSSNKSPMLVLSGGGIDLTIRNDNDGKGYHGRREHTQFMLRHTDIDVDRCQPILEALQTYRWKEGGKEPEHDEASHAATMVEYGYVNLRKWFEEMLDEKKKSRATGTAGRSGGVFAGGGTLAQALRDEEAQIRETEGRSDYPKMGYTGRGGRSITGY